MLRSIRIPVQEICITFLDSAIVTSSGKANGSSGATEEEEDVEAEEEEEAGAGRAVDVEDSEEEEEETGAVFPQEERSPRLARSATNIVFFMNI